MQSAGSSIDSQITDILDLEPIGKLDFDPVVLRGYKLVNKIKGAGMSEVYIAH